MLLRHPFFPPLLHGNQGILHVLERPEYGALIGRERLPHLRFRRLDLVPQGGRVQERRADASKGAKGAERSLSCESGELKRGDPRIAGERHSGKPLRLGDADIRRGGGQVLLRHQNIGSPLEEIRWKTGRDLWWHDLLGEARAARDAHRPVSEEHAEQILFLHRLLLEIGELRRRARPFGLELVEVQLRNVAVLEPDSGDPDALLPGFERPLRDLDLEVQRAQLKVRLGDIADQTDDNRPLVLHLSKELGLGSFNRSVDAAPYINLPSNADSSEFASEVRAT